MKRTGQRGSTMLESLFGMCFLLFLCFSLVELFIMIGRQMAMDYASFYGAKALALGYAGANCQKAIRVAGIPASGADVSSESKVPLQPSSSSVRSALRTQAARYMSLGRPSGVEYEYWYNDGQKSHFTFTLSAPDETVRCGTILRNPEFLMEPVGKLMSIAESNGLNSAEPEGECKMYNHAQQWMTGP